MSNAHPPPPPPASAFPELSSARVTDLLDFSPDALIVVNQAGTLVQVNELAAALFGYPREALVGQPLEVLLPKRFHTLHVTHRDHYTTASQPRSMGMGLELFGRRTDGSEFPVDVSLRPVLMGKALHIIGAVRDVTTQHLAERERARLAERLRLQADLIDLVHDAMLVRDPVSRVVSWSRGAEALYGWTEQEALGRVSYSLLQTRWPVSLAAVNAQLEREGHWEGKLVHTRRDGRIVVVDSRQVLFRDEHGQRAAILEINRESTEQHRPEQAQHVTQETTTTQLTMFRQLLDVLPNGVYLVRGHQARLVLANRAATSIWGASWQPDQPMREFLTTQGIHIVDDQGRLVPPDIWATMRALQHGETVQQRQEIIRQPGGASLPILVNAVLLPPRDFQGLLGQSSQQRGEELEPLALVVLQDVTPLKEAEYFKDEFLAVVAHELRTPLAVLKVAVSTLLVQTARGRGPALAAWQQETLQELEQATDRLTALTKDLLDVTRLQVGRLILQRTPTDVVALTRRAVNDWQQTTTRHRLEVRTEHTVLHADIDPGRIEQVLTNLLSNAIKYSPQGGPVVATLWEEAATGTVGISVQDGGMGIPKDQQAHIFGRFMRADNAQAAGLSGAGLGLYLCRALVEQHRGHLWFESTEGVGSTFFVTLPRPQDQSSPSGAESNPSAEGH